MTGALPAPARSGTGPLAHAPGVLVRAVDPDEVDLVEACGALVADVYGGEDLLEDEDGYLPVLRDAAPRAREAVLLAATATTPNGSTDGLTPGATGPGTTGPDATGPDTTGQVLLGSATYARAGSRWAELARPGEAEMRMLAVSAVARGRGIGRLLTLACLEQARREGCTRFVLSSGPRMTTAHRLYEGMGFVRTPARDWSPVPHVDLVTYGLDLA